MKYRWLQPAPLLAVVLFGGVSPGIRLGLREIPVVSFAGLRVALAVVVLFAAVWIFREEHRIRRRTWRPLLIAGLAQTAFQALLVLGLNPSYGTTAGNITILSATAPTLVAGWLALTGQQRIGRRQGWGLLIGLTGVGLVVARSGVGLAESHLVGNFIALAAAAAWAWYGLAIGPVVRDMGAIQATAWTLLLAGCLFIPLTLAGVGGHVAWSSVSWEAWASLVYGATAGMVLAMTLWGKSIRRLGPKQTMVYAYIGPVATVAIEAIILSEALGLVQAAGAALAFVGVWLVSSQAEERIAAIN